MQHNGEPCDTRFWQGCDDGWTVDSTMRGGWQRSRAVQVCPFSKPDAKAQQGITRIGPSGRHDFHRVGCSDESLMEQHRGLFSRGWSQAPRLQMWSMAPGFELYQDQELPTEVRDLCMEVPRKRHGVSLLGSATNMQFCMRVGLGQPAEPPTQTRFWQRYDYACAVDSTTRGGWQGSQALQVMFVLGLEFASPSLTSWLRTRSRGLACRMT